MSRSCEGSEVHELTLTSSAPPSCSNWAISAAPGIHHPLVLVLQSHQDFPSCDINRSDLDIPTENTGGEETAQAVEHITPEPQIATTAGPPVTDGPGKAEQGEKASNVEESSIGAAS